MRGRTYSHAGYAASADISIPAPVRGRTCAGPRRAAGCPPISIPAPARGRTDYHHQRRHGNQISIPAPARGRTALFVSVPYLLIFQFPPPRGGEPRYPALSCPLRRDFNSRPREGANVFLSRVLYNIWISIPAPARGRTKNNIILCNLLMISIPAPARGRTAKLHKIEQSILSVC